MATSKRRHSDPLEDLRVDFEMLREDVGALAQIMKEEVRFQEKDLAGKASERVVALRSAGEHRLEEIRTRATEAAKRAETTVREHPGYAVAGAAALGFMLGALALRRR